MAFDPESDAPMIGPQLCQQTKRFKQYLAAISVSLGATCAGSVLSWSSPALSQLLPKNITNETDIIPENGSPFTVTPSETALIGSMVGIGAMISAVPAGYFADIFGRKKIILASALPFILNWILIIFAINPQMIIAGRFFAGIGTGAICVLAPMYIGEIAETSTRGILGTFVQTCMCVGILTTSIVGAFTTWQTLSMVVAIIPMFFAMTFWFMPESPVYLVEINDITAAEESLRDIRGSSYDIDSELKSIQRNVEEAHGHKTSFSELFSSKAHRRAFFAGIVALSFQQLCGVNAMVFYTAPIFKSAGSSLQPDIAAIIINSVQAIVAYFAAFFIEKANRKYFLIISSAGMIICFIGLGMFFHVKHIIGHMGNFGFVPILCSVLYMVSFCVGFGPVPWLLLSELYPPEIKGIATGAAVTSNWFCAFLVTFCFPLLTSSLGDHYTFYIFAALNGLAILMVAIFIPETKGRSLEEIQNILKK